jgi:formate hydrogenlyase transcriptional activator
MSRDLRVLILDDVLTDAELIERELRKAGLAFAVRFVATRGEFMRELRSFAPTLILADYSMPGFRGSEALEIVRQEWPDLPFVFVSGALGEELAIDTLKQGATDYVLKHRLSRLGPAVRRALAEAEERAARRAAEDALRRSEERHRVLLQINNAIVANLDREALFDAIGDALGQVLPFDRMSLALYRPDADVLRVITLRGWSRPDGFGAPGTEVSRPGSHLGWVFTHRRPLVRRDLEREREFPAEEQLFEQGLRSYVVVPLIGKKRALGTLNVGSLTPDRYGQDDVDWLNDVAQQVALALENTEAYDEIAQLKAQLERENLYLQEEIKTHHNFDEIVGHSPALREVLQAVETVAPTDATVLINGETGTGKELVARALHHLSPVRGKPLVKVNCAALPATLIESELFGHERGAFTGALTRKPGRFELANGGTIFLDEIGDLPLELQGKLLRVLQEGEFERVGGSSTLRVKVRVIAATNRDLEQAIEEDTFRPDLYYRLNVFPVAVPALRDRPEDIPELVRHFVDKYCARVGRRIDRISAATLHALQEYSWPGNIRELENVIERAVILSRGRDLEIGDWFRKPRAGAERAPRPEAIDEVQRAHIVSVLERVGWRVSGEGGAASILRMKPTTLEARMKKLGIRRPVPGGIAAR